MTGEVRDVGRDMQIEHDVIPVPPGKVDGGDFWQQRCSGTTSGK
jgi:hypothetical protein